MDANIEFIYSVLWWTDSSSTTNTKSLTFSASKQRIGVSMCLLMYVLFPKKRYSRGSSINVSNAFSSHLYSKVLLSQDCESLFGWVNSKKKYNILQLTSSSKVKISVLAFTMWQRQKKDYCV